ncbi:putative rhamnogalacturonate lyase C [Tolypocladium ophioglossoides CBS 100239]|uniref:Putative rhamnogalacturonate lyase C n=1 Tax=Tolypocladium ophioglossoides (strain CBS 100239) TaxID=1163406 RepID=A0A0L0N779_TOLOC|nr:putative rhamnogalacturonate lyase C [Tolypocladium ophioglossoides CBS 100239]
MASSAGIKTRILIISDTHGRQPHTKAPDDPDTDVEIATKDILRVATGFRSPLPEADVAIHCGDLTARSSVAEFEATFSMLRALRAPLKLVIAGNHDRVLDSPDWDSDTDDTETPQRVRGIIAQARQDGVRYLVEGSYAFALRNGALLRVYASPYTPSYGRWAFQYEGAHDFAIPPGVDVAMTHGPPYGILDTAGLAQLMGLPAEHAGCPSLFRAVHRARPRIHCFGHIHEAWGSYLATWKPDAEVRGSVPSCETAIDAANSRLETSRGLKPSSRAEKLVMTEDKVRRLAQLSRQRGVHVDLTEGETRLEQGRQTLFVNAAIMDMGYRPTQLPWIVDLDLPRAETQDVEMPG